MEITKNNLSQAIGALRQCAKENENKNTDTGCIRVSDLCNDVATYLEKELEDMKQCAKKLEKIGKQEKNIKMKKNYKWNKESFLKFIEDSKANVEIINNQIENTVLLHVKDYYTMNMLFYGKASWCITSSKTTWDNYTNKGQRKQYVWVNFNVEETKRDAFIGFTVEFRPDETFIYAAHDKDDYRVSTAGKFDTTVETIKQGLINKGINLKEIFKENNMVVISLTFFNEDSGVVKNDIIPCTSIDIAKNISLKLHKEHSFSFCKIERDKHEKCTEWDENGGWTVNFGDGYMKCKIYDTEEINEKNVHTFNYDWSKVSLPWSKWYKEIGKKGNNHNIG